LAVEEIKRLNDCLQDENVISREQVDQPTDPALEMKRLQRCMDDLAVALALPAAWRGREPAEILFTLVDSLIGTLALDFFYARVVVEAGEKPLEMLRTRLSHRTDEIGQFLDDWLDEDRIDRPSHARCKIGNQEISIFSARLGVEGDLGFIVAGSQRLGFPEQSERLVLGVAANQTAAALQNARLLSEQKRIASELERRVTERTRELAEANRELQLHLGLLQNLPVSAWTLKPDGTPDFVNRVWLEFSGQTLDFVRSYPEAWMSAVHPEDRETASRTFWEGVRSGQGFAFETRSLRAQDGTYRWHLQQAVVLRDAEGKVLKFVGTTTDIDELKQSEARHRVVVETASDSVVSIDEGGAIILANPATKRIFGYDPEELIGKPLTVLMPGAMRQLHETGLKRYLETGAKHLNWRGTEMTAQRANGEEFPAEVSFGEMTADQRRVFTGFIRDISEKKRSEEELRNAQAELARMTRVMTIGQLTASIAHEVSQPLSGIIMNASTCLRMLKSDPPNIDGARETVQRTIRDGNRTSEVITRLRTLFSKKQIDVEPLDLNEAAREIIALLSGELERNNVILKHEFSDYVPVVDGDRVQLQQVILNLIRNGSDAMDTVNDRPRHLIVRTEMDGNHVTVSVQDSGVGFSPEIGERLFEPFFTSKQEGMGIGLSVSRSIVEAHQGRLWAARNDGPGATFAFSIPCDHGSYPQEQA
jgi:PAS domain S-box-containing protein